MTFNADDATQEKLGFDIKTDSELKSDIVKKTKTEIKEIDLQPQINQNSLNLYKVKQLPSEFKLFPDGKKTNIQFYNYDWQQVRQINNSELTTRQFWDLVLSKIIMPKGFDKLDLTFSDFQWIGLLIRLNTLGFGEFTIQMNCYNRDSEILPRCDYKNKFKFKDKQIEFDNMELTEKDLQSGIYIDWKDKSYNMSPFTIGDALKLMDSKMYGNTMAVLASQIRNQPIEDSLKELSDPNFNTDVGLLMDEVDEMFSHRVVPFVRPCEKCKRDLVIILDMGGTIIKPFREQSDNGRPRIRIGKMGTSTDRLIG